MSEIRGPYPEPYPVRPITLDEFDRFAAVNEHAFGWAPMTPESRRRSLARLELDRTLAAFDSGEPVGVTAAYSFRLTVPGEQALPTAGVTWVGVLPTRRRRGVLRSLMRRQLADIRERGESLAALWASEAVIYGRYGYGRSSWQADFTVHRGEGGLDRTAPADDHLDLRLIDPVAALPELIKVYEAVLPTRPGFWARNEAWWQRLTSDPPEERHGAGPLRCMLVEDDSGPRGYVVYNVMARWDSDTGLPDSTLNVRELMAADPAAWATLWSNLLDRDLTTTFRAEGRPIDDPLLYQLADPRRTRTRLTDGLWVRVVDVAAALAGRRYSAPVDAVLEIRDEILPENNGRWRLATAGGVGASGGAFGAGLAASCVPVDAEPDVTLDVTQLGAAYLGGIRLAALAQAGLVTEHRPGAVRELSAALAWDPAPWCPMIF